MKEDEDIASYFQRVDIVQNEVKIHDSNLIDEDMIEKDWMTLPKSYNDKVSTIEKINNPMNFTKEDIIQNIIIGNP
jgi:hypothetical protein